MVGHVSQKLVGSDIKFPRSNLNSSRAVPLKFGRVVTPFASEITL